MGNVEFLQGLYGAFGEGDMPTVLGGMHPEIEWREAESNPYQPGGEPFVGPDAVVENLFTRLATEWDGFTIHPKEFHDAGDTVVVEGRYTGTHNDTGNGIDAQFCHVWRVRDGKVTSFQQFTDTAQLQDAMGAR